MHSQTAMRPLGAVSALLSLGVLACSGEIVGVDDRENDQKTDYPPPTIEVTAPARATFAETDTVVVRGVADAPAGLAEVAVNGEPVEVSEDGSFSHTLELTDSITLLETVAIDEGGREAADARAVLTGALIDQKTPVEQAMSAHVSGAAMAGLGDMVSTFANDTDWTALAKEQNPVASSGSGCNQYQAYVTNVAHGDIQVATGAATGGIAVDLEIQDLRVTGHIDWRGACISGTTSFVITADAYEMGGLVTPGFFRGSLNVAIQNVSSQFANFRLDASGVPGFVEDGFRTRARDYLAGMARDWVKAEVPPIAGQFLSDFAENEVAFEVLGQTIQIEIRPAAMEWTESGGTVVLENTAYVPGAEGGVYVSSPASLPSPGSLEGSDLEVALADDTLNQLLAAIWHSGALEDTILPEEANALGAILHAEVSRATATMLLPPVVTFDGERGVSRLTVGDVLIEAFGGDGESLATFALSAEIEVKVGQRDGGGLRLKTGTSRVLAQVLEKGPGVSADGAALSSLVELVVPQLGRQANSLLEVIQVPGLPGGEIGAPTIQPANGYLMAGGQLAFE